RSRGPAWRGQLVGTFGTFAMFSVYPTKNVASGEGGMVAADEEVAGRLRLLRNQGMERQYANEVVGFNARMSDVHAAIGRAQLGNLAGWTATRVANAAFLDEQLVGVTTPVVRAGARHVYHQYTIRLPGASEVERDEFADALRARGVGSGVYYQVTYDRLDSLVRYGQEGQLPVSDRAASEVLSLRVHPGLSKGDREKIVTVVNTVAA